MTLKTSKQPFACIVGSRAHGLEKSESDLDLLMLSTSGYRHGTADGWNTVYRSVEMLMEGISGEQQYIHTWQALYPERFFCDCALAEWITGNRDALVYENRANVFRTARAYFEQTERNLEAYYAVASKRVMYALLHGRLLSDYAAGATFASCMRPSGAWKQTLLAVRDRKLSTDEVRALFDQTQSGITESAAFYAEEAEKPVLQSLREAVAGQEFMSYEELREAGVIGGAAELYDANSALEALEAAYDEAGT